MAKQSINVGATANDKKGDSLRAAFQKVNANFTELYTALGLAADGTLNLGAFEFTGSVMSTTDSSSIIIDQAVTVTSDLTVSGDVVPNTANGGDLGSAAKPWRSLHVSANTVFLGGVPLGLEAGTNELTINNVPISETINYADIPGTPTIPNLNSITQSIIPATNVAYDLGSTTYRFRDLYLSGNTIDLGGALITATADGNVSLPGVTEVKFKPESILDTRQHGETFYHIDAISQSAVIIDQATFSWAMNNPTPPAAYPGTFEPSVYSATFNGSGFITAISLDQANYYDDTNNWVGVNNDNMFALSPGTVLTRQSIYNDVVANGGPLAVLAAAIVSTSNSVPSLSIPADVSDLTDTGNLLTSPTLNVLKIDDGVHEKFQTKENATGTVTHDCALGHIFYHTSPDANWTANFTNLNLSTIYATSLTLIIVQGATGYYPSAVQIGGAAQTINWQGNVNPTVSSSRTDVVTFSIINNSGTYIVLGQLTGF